MAISVICDKALLSVTDQFSKSVTCEKWFQIIIIIIKLFFFFFFFFYRRDRASLNYSISILLVWRKMLTSLIWAGSSEFGSYHLCEQRRFGRSCASPDSQLLAQTSNESRRTFRQKARSLAPLNDWAWAVKIFHDQECSKTQIRLTRPIFLR